jgi:hypothetical protein
MKNVLLYIISKSMIGTIALLALLFIPAGTFNYWQGWAYVATFVVCSHQGLGHIIEPQYNDNIGEIFCIERLGGLLKSYHCKAA